MERQIGFPAEEYEGRLKRVQDQMARQDLECLLVSSPESVCYLTGYQTFGEAAQFLLVPIEGHPVLVLRELESLLAVYTTWGTDCVTYGDHEDPLVSVANTVRERQLAQAMLAVEEKTGCLSPASHRRLGDLLAGLRLRGGDGLVEACRAVKSEAEIAACREAATITGIGMDAAIDASARGSTENAIAAAAAEAMTVAGSEWLANDPIVTSGHRSGIPHTTYARRALEPGDTVLIELGGSFHRYFGPLMRTVNIGAPDPTVVRLHRACQEALEAAMDSIRPGITSAAAHAACQEVIDEYGYQDLFKKRLGYATGIGFNTWSEGRIFDLKLGDDRVIEGGMVFHMPPALRIPQTVGVGISETIVVTEDGCECLTSYPRRLFLSK